MGRQVEGYNENLLQDNLKLFQHNIYSFFRLEWLQISNNDCFQIFCRIFNPFSWALLSCSLSFSNFLIITTKSTSFCRNSKYAESTLIFLITSRIFHDFQIKNHLNSKHLSFLPKPIDTLSIFQTFIDNFQVRKVYQIFSYKIAKT